ncbi:chondroitinase-B domain-containing protein [Flavivirga eckloniae]|uniref:Alginate lyase n=1 Tax=Flavivirga eckloniae TaxID=1803846 RepID=A0A2K9PNQ2_9FLAO|nr:chondroitinase-B domain-containing protein [Flavivirga eckloniae]AUP78684.1 alginate lyase [Flavivirga eckloniae]
MKKITLHWLLLFSISVIGQTTYNITDPEDLENNVYVAGDEIILANGVYSTDERIDFVGMGTADNPIVFRAESPGGVIFTGGLRMNVGGEYLVIDGFYWNGGEGVNNHIQFRNGTDYARYCTIQNCTINGLEPEPDDPTTIDDDESTSKHRWVVLYGQYNNVINCSFLNKRSPGALVLVELSYNFDNGEATAGHQIINNYFYNYEKRDPATQNAGDSETIRVGASNYQAFNANVNVEGNYFNKSDGENEIITNKSANNIYKNNTFRACRGSLVLRHGANATVEGNYFLGENVEGTGGVRISDSGHTISNNYFQDLINENEQAQWNNGITFLGGSETSGGSSNGYQKTENVLITHNSFYNVHSPLYFNTSKGSTDPIGTFTNNLFYTTLTTIITGDFSDLGSGLTFGNNVYQGTTLGATLSATQFNSGTIGFAADGETFLPSDSGDAANNAIVTTPEIAFDITGLNRPSTGKDIGASEVSGATGTASFSPHADSDVGDSVGSCFIGAQGVLLTVTTCTIASVETLYVSDLSEFGIDGGSQNTTVTANIDWNVETSDSWITTDVSSGSGSATVAVTVTENTNVTERTGHVTFTKVGGTLSRVLSVTQAAPDITELYDLINTGLAGDPVTIHSFSKEEVNGTTKFNYAANTLDKDNGTVWAADDGSIVSGDYKGDGEYIIYDLGDEYNLDLVRFSTTNKSDPFGFQVWVSTTGTDSGDFTMALPTTGDLLLTATSTTDFNQYEVTANARYIKLIGYGRFNSAGDTRKSVWNAVGEIEFYGTQSSLSTKDIDHTEISIFPVPAKDVINIRTSGLNINKINVYSLDGRLVMNKDVTTPKSQIILNISSLLNGPYLINFSNDSGLRESKMIIISR